MRAGQRVGGAAGEAEDGELLDPEVVEQRRDVGRPVGHPPAGLRVGAAEARAVGHHGPHAPAPVVLGVLDVALQPRAR